MPRENIDYSNTVIYKLVCNDLNIKDLYVGHTTHFIKRKWKHKSSCCNEDGKDYNLKVYQFIRENGGWDNWSMIEIEKFPCKDVYEATKRERYWYETLNAKLNSTIPYRTRQEYNNLPEVIEHRKDYMTVYRKDYREENRETLNEKDKKYRETHKEQRRLYTEKNRSKLNEQARLAHLRRRDAKIAQANNEVL